MVELEWGHDEQWNWKKKKVVWCEFYTTNQFKNHGLEDHLWWTWSVEHFWSADFFKNNNDNNNNKPRKHFNMLILRHP